MKKRLFFCLLAALLLLLAACGGEEAQAPMVQPVTFYYRTARTDYSSEEGVIRGELRDLGPGIYTDQELFALYFQGPDSEELIAPFSKDTELVSARRGSGTLEIWLVRDANSPSEFEHALTYACLAKTGLALEGVRKVRIVVNSRGGAALADVLLSESDLLLFDDGEVPDSQEITLYYMDEEGRFLLPEKRTIPLMPQEQLPQYVLELLLEPPDSGGMRSPLPPGTAILDVIRDGSLWMVDFSGEFYRNRPEDEQAELLAVLSVVNTLCELDDVNQVQIFSEGRRLSPYVRLDLSYPWVLDGTVLGPLREELGEFAGELCLPGQRDGLLHRMTIRARARGGASRETALLLALFSRSAQNGLSAPFAGAGVPVSAVTEGGVCTVELASGTLPGDGGARELAIRSLTATLCSLPEVEAVRLLEDGQPVGEEALSPAESWFCPAP